MHGPALLFKKDRIFQSWSLESQTGAFSPPRQSLEECEPPRIYLKEKNKREIISNHIDKLYTNVTLPILSVLLTYKCIPCKMIESARVQSNKNPVINSPNIAASTRN